MIERHLFSADYTAERAWRLCEWCRARGADEFTLTILGVEPTGSPAYTALEEPLRPFARPTAVREQVTARPGQPFLRPAELWALTADSLARLPALFPQGPFRYQFGRGAWCEDLILYRDGQLMLGIVSHEDWGLLRLSALEAAELTAAQFPNQISA